MKRLRNLWQSIQDWAGWRVMSRMMTLLALAAAGYGIYWVVTIAIPAGYNDPQTGFSGKTYWDWMELLAALGGGILVPIAVAYATFAITSQQERNRQRSEQAARDLEAERARENAVQKFLDDIGQLIREDSLGVEPPKTEKAADKARRERILAMVQAKVNTILSLMKDDNPRRIHAIEFLGRSGLITKHGVNMEGANLSGVNLTSANLYGAYLSKANLQEASLSMANLREAVLDHVNLQGAFLELTNLQGATLSWANLQEASCMITNLQDASLIYAKLQGANLVAARLQNAKLQSADLKEAGLIHAKLQGAQLSGAVFDETTILPNDQTWTFETDMGRFTNPGHPDFLEPSEPPDLFLLMLEQSKHLHYYDRANSYEFLPRVEN